MADSYWLVDDICRFVREETLLRYDGHGGQRQGGVWLGEVPRSSAEWHQPAEPRSWVMGGGQGSSASLPVLYSPASFCGYGTD